MDYADYKHLTFEPKPNGVLLVTINRPEVLNAANARLHWEFTQVWLTVDADPKTRVVLVTGAGKAFSAAVISVWSRRWRGIPTRSCARCARPPTSSTT